MPRKSTASNQESAAVTPQKELKESTEQEWEKEVLGLDDLTLPRSVVLRLAKGVLPPNTQIAKDAQTALWKSATVFVSYLASHANENSMRSNKKTIQPTDVFDAVRDLEFEAFMPRLEAELKKYNTTQCDKRNSYRRKIREEAKVKTDQEPGDETTSGPGAIMSVMDGMMGDGVQVVIPSPSGKQEDDAERVTKKMRRSPGAEGEDDEDQDDIDDVQEEEIEDEEMDEEEVEEEEEEEEQEEAEVEKEDPMEERALLVEEDEAIEDEDEESD